MIDTATNTVVATVPVGSDSGPFRVAVAPDGKHAYVANNQSNTVSVIDTSTNKVVATVTVGAGPFGVGIIPPPPSIHFSAFSPSLRVQLGHSHFNLNASFILGSARNGINPPGEPVTLKVGTFTTTIPPGSGRSISKG